MRKTLPEEGEKCSPEGVQVFWMKSLASCGLKVPAKVCTPGRGGALSMNIVTLSVGTTAARRWSSKGTVAGRRLHL